MGAEGRQGDAERGHGLIAILGPTACGKTRLAVNLAARIGGEILSADSRQLYAGMDIGTGKDLAEYTLADGRCIPYHLIDICRAGERYDLFRYQSAFCAAHASIAARGAWPILCGGSGLYAESVIRGYELVQVDPDPALRASLGEKSLEELIGILSGYGPLHNTTDITSRSRLIRAIEIAQGQTGRERREAAPLDVAGVFAIDVPRTVRRDRIATRLRTRLKAGLVEEVERLRAEGVEDDTLLYYGLEYKFTTQFLRGEYRYDEFVDRLTIAIQQFAKRQMTYLRGMERRGVRLVWIDGTKCVEEQLAAVMRHLNVGEVATWRVERDSLLSR